jgi:hypothetical protein
VLLDLLGDVLGEFIPTPHRLQRWVYRHPMLSSAGTGGVAFAGLTLALWVSGEAPIPWALPGSVGLGLAVFVRLLMAMNVYVAKHQTRRQHVPLDEKRRMSVNTEPRRAKHGPNRLSPEEPLPRLFEPPGVPRRPEVDG